MKHERIPQPSPMSKPDAQSIRNEIHRELAAVAAEWSETHDVGLPIWSLCEAADRGLATAIRKHRGQP